MGPHDQRGRFAPEVRHARVSWQLQGIHEAAFRGTSSACRCSGNEVIEGIYVVQLRSMGRLMKTSPRDRRILVL